MINPRPTFTASVFAFLAGWPSCTRPGAERNLIVEPEMETAVDRLDSQTDWQEICDRNCVPYNHANVLKPSPNRIRCAQYINLARWLLDKLMWAVLFDIILGGVLCAVWAICVRIQEFLAR